VPESTTPISTQSGANRTVLRVAWGVIGVGVLVALAAAIAGGRNPNADVMPVRDVAAVIMLIGLLLVLGAHRVAWAKKRWEWSDMTLQADETRRRNTRRLSWVIACSMLLGGAFLVVTAIALVGGLIAGCASLLLIAMILAALVSVLVYGKGYLRTFGVGAIIPMGLQALSASGAYVVLFLSPSSWQMSGLFRFETQILALVIGGVSAIAAGVVAMMVRFLVESLMPSREPPAGR
jgi:hypothetical protein